MYANVYASDPISHASQIFLYRPQQNSTAPPFPVLDQEELFYHELLFHRQASDVQEDEDDNVAIASGTVQMSNRVITASGNEDDIKQQKQTLKRRGSKRERNTKIDTSNGPRDRRMRMSLEVARKFFSLQDKLGFDKPSRTIEWLLHQAKYEIQRVEREINFPAQSESEVVSSLAEITTSAYNGITRQSKNCVSTPRTREVREKARERARERTKEKNKSRIQQFPQEHTLCQNSSDSSLYVMSSAQERSLQTKEQSDVCHELCSTATMTNWNLSFLFNSLHNPQIAQFADLQFLDKQWETNNTRNLH